MDRIQKLSQIYASLLTHDANQPSSYFTLLSNVLGDKTLSQKDQILINNLVNSLSAEKADNVVQAFEMFSDDLADKVLVLFTERKFLIKIISALHKYKELYLKTQGSKCTFLLKYFANIK